MTTYTGTCSGGPWHGQHLTHWQRTLKLYRPMVAFSLNMEDAPIEVVEVGEYELDDFDRWNWHPTASGRALSQLFGATHT